MFKEPAQPVTFLKKINLHFEVPFECHSLDLASILFHCYVQAPHKSMMLDADGIELKTLGKSLWACVGGGKGTNSVYLFV